MVNAAVAQWFFRLNGCLTTREFVVHPDLAGSNLTDIDILAVRFPWRSELDMKDHPGFAVSRTTLLLVEVKLSGPCRFNDSWFKDDGGPLRRVLDAVGCYQHESAEAAAALVQSGTYVGKHVDATLVAIASAQSDSLRRRLPRAIQYSWREVLLFIYERFTKYANEKADHDSWDQTGQELYDAAVCSDFRTFCAAVRDLYEIKVAV